jgi:hypothetical protein
MSVADGGQTNVVAFEGFHEGFGHAIAFKIVLSQRNRPNRSGDKKAPSRGLGHRRGLVVAVLLGVFAVFGTTGIWAKGTATIPPVDKTVLVFHTENVVVDNSPVKPDIPLRAYDRLGLLNTSGGTLDCQFGDFTAGFYYCFASYRTTNPGDVSTQIFSPSWGSVVPVFDIATDRFQDGGRFAMILETKFNRYRNRDFRIFAKSFLVSGLYSLADVRPLSYFDEDVGPLDC